MWVHTGDKLLLSYFDLFKRKQSDVLFKLWLHIFDILNHFFLLSPMQGTQKSSQKNLLMSFFRLFHVHVSYSPGEDV